MMCYEDYCNLKQLQSDIIKDMTPQQAMKYELGLYSLDAILEEADTKHMKIKVNDIVIIKDFDNVNWEFKPEACKEIEIGSLGVVTSVFAESIICVHALLSYNTVDSKPFTLMFEAWEFSSKSLEVIDSL